MMSHLPRWGKALLCLSPAPLAALCLKALSRRPDWVEAVFSRSWYPTWSAWLARLSARVPSAVAERLLILCVCGVIVLLCGRIAQAIGQRRLRPLARYGFRMVCALSALYAAFVVMWGVHFVRQPFAVAADMAMESADVGQLSALCDLLLKDATALRSALPTDDQGVYRSPDDLSTLLARVPAAYASLAETYPWLAGDYPPPKVIAHSQTLSDMQIMGIFIPFTGEALLNRDIPDTQLAHTAAHEAAHQRGYAREAEADYVGYLACMASGDQGMAYSGTLTMLRYAALSLWEADPLVYDAFARRIPAEIDRDYDRQFTYWQAHDTPLAGLVSLTNERYLHTFALKISSTQRSDVVSLLMAHYRAALRLPPN